MNTPLIDTGRLITRDEALRLLAAIRAETIRVLGEELAGDPALDILLGIFSAGSHGGMADTGANTPDRLRAALRRRWISMLEQRGWIERCDHPRSPGNAVSVLTSSGEQKLVVLLDRVATLLATTVPDA